MKLSCCLLVLAVPVFAQLVDTGPRKNAGYTVSGLPSAASYSGFTAVVTDAATAGSCTSGGGTAISLCRSNGSAWISLGGAAGGASSISGLTDLQVTRTSSTVLNIAAGSARIGSVVVAFSAATATLSGTSASSTAYVYVDATGTMIVGHNGATTVTCSGCTTATGVSAFPVSASEPIATATYTSAAWDVSGITDKRVILAGSLLAAGTGVSITTNAAGLQTVASTVAGATIGKGVFASRPSCAAGTTQMYNNTDDPGITSICDGSSWTDYFQNVPITRPAAAASFTVVNGGTLADAGSTITFSKSTSGLSVALLAFPDTAASWDVRMAISAYGQNGATATQECGLWITNGTVAGTSNAHGFVIASTLAFLGEYLRRSYSPINGSLTDEGITLGADFATRPVWFRLTRSAGNVTAYVGDGVLWKSVHTDAPGFTATHYGIGCDPRASAETIVRVVSLSVQ